MAKKEKRDGWGLFLLFWTMLLLLLGFLACVFFYKYAAVYEQTRPEKAMDTILATMSEDELHRALAESVTEVSEYEDGRELFENFYAQSVQGKELSYRRDLSRGGDDQTVFFLYAYNDLAYFHSFLMASIAMGLIGLAVFILIVIPFSSAAIRPVEEAQKQQPCRQPTWLEMQTEFP